MNTSGFLLHEIRNMELNDGEKWQYLIFVSSWSFAYISPDLNMLYQNKWTKLHPLELPGMFDIPYFRRNEIVLHTTWSGSKRKKATIRLKDGEWYVK